VTVGLTAVLLFVVLFFIYPLKFMMGIIVDLMTHASSDEALRTMFPKADRGPLQIIFGLGFAAVFGVFALMYAHAYRLRDSLKLNELEVLDTIEAIRATSLAAAVGLSMAVSFAVGMAVPSIKPIADNVGVVLVLGISLAQFRRRVMHRTRRRTMVASHALSAE
jgi:hypothetical protein